MSSDFVHLHAHSEYSLLDGLSNIEQMTKRVADLGMNALALTDHGVMYGAIEFYSAAKKAGIKPIIGCEAYVATGRHNQKGAEGKGYFHTVLLAKDLTGYHNLLKLSTLAHLDGYYYKPRIDRELLAEYKEGLIVSQACISGEVNRRLTQRDKEGARAAAAWYRDVLGPEHYYLELQLHPEVPELDEINQELIKIGKELGIPLVATNDAHFIDQQDADTHRMLRCLGFNTTVEDYCRKSPELDDSYFLQSPEQMQKLMAAYPSEAIDNTRLIADRCNLDLEFGRVQLPEFPLPEGHTPASYLQHLSEEGLVRRLGNPPKHYWERLHYELEVINQTGFPLYMLIVWDFVKFARAQSIPCLPRGSAGGSLVLYCLGITDVDPVANKLVFERFLNPERKEMPDIDMDFADTGRAEVIDYVVEKYGSDRTAQIITFGTLGAKAALRDVGRVLNIPLNTVDQVAKLVPKLPVGTTLTQSLERVPELKKLYDSDVQLRDLIDRARKLEGVTRNVGTHACGVVVAAQPLRDIVPLQLVKKSAGAAKSNEKTDKSADDAEGKATVIPVMACFPMGTLGDIGLLKMDMLGLTNLSIVDAALKYIGAELGRPFTLADVPTDDLATLEMLSRGNTLGVFQLESPPMVRYLKELKPSRIEDIYAMVALYRPGPMAEIPKYIEWKNHPERITYLHPVLKPILEDTYGVIVYQEQVLGILMQMAGYTMGKADIVRKAIGKKNRELMAKEEPRFIEGCVKNGLNADQAHTLWSLIQPFAGYSFNRAHSTLYGLLSYQTAYLKTNYPAEYMAALLSSAAGNMEDVARYVGESMRLGVDVRPPDINYSNLDFSIERLDTLEDGVTHPKAVRFGLSAIKGLGAGPIQAICAAREADGPFRSLEDLCSRVDRKEATKRVFESLIKCGALDQLPGARRQKLAILDQVIGAVADMQRSRDSGQVSIFDMFAAEGPSQSSVSIPFPTVREGPNEEKESLAWEKELLGMYISAHPLVHALGALPPDPNRLSLSMLTEDFVGQKVTLIGMLIGLRKLQTKKGDMMLSAQFEDLQTMIDVVAFPRVYEKFQEFWKEDNIVALTGKLDNRRDALQLIVDSVALLSEVELSAPVVTESPLSYLTDGLPGDPDLDSTPVDDETWRASLPTSVEAIMRPVPPEPVLSPAPPAGRNGNNANGSNGTIANNANGSHGTNGGHGANGQAPAKPVVAQHATNDPAKTPAPAPSSQPAAPPIARASEPSAAPSVAPSGSATVLRPRQRITIAKKEEAAPAPSSGTPAPPTPSGPQPHLHITLPRSGNDDADIRCMQEVHRLLCRFEGQHKVTLYIPQDVNQVVLEPIRRITAAPDLVQQLTDLLGVGAVMLEQK